MVVIYGILHNRLCLDHFFFDLSDRFVVYLTDLLIMQEIITWIIIIVALVLLILNLIKAIKMFRKPDPCRGCGNTCSGCPIYMGSKKE